jgi:hypothetical protein
VRLEEPRPAAEGLGDVAVDIGTREMLSVGDLIALDILTVERDVALREHLGVAPVDRSDMRPAV